MIGFSDDIKRLSPYFKTFPSIFSREYLLGIRSLYKFPEFRFYESQYRTNSIICLNKLFNYKFFHSKFDKRCKLVGWFGWFGNRYNNYFNSLSTFNKFKFYNDFSFYNALVISSFLGSLIGFLIYNRKPAKILMGRWRFLFFRFFILHILFYLIIHHHFF